MTNVYVKKGLVEDTGQLLGVMVYGKWLNQCVKHMIQVEQVWQIGC